MIKYVSNNVCLILCLVLFGFVSVCAITDTFFTRDVRLSISILSWLAIHVPSSKWRMDLLLHADHLTDIDKPNVVLGDGFEGDGHVAEALVLVDGVTDDLGMDG